MGLLEGKNALIFGLANDKSIAWGITQAFKREGANLGISYAGEILERRVKPLAAQAGCKWVEECDVTSDEHIAATVEKAAKHFGKIDILVNNAAANPVFGPVVDTEEWAIDKIMQVNVKAPFELSKLVYPIMKASGGGSIINISSIAGITPDTGLGIYSVSKAALNMLTKVTAKEWGKDGIRVNVICPGLIKTKFSEALWQNEKWLQKFAQQLPLGRMGTGEEMAAMGLFLASDASAYCTGTVFMADGGATI